MSRHRLPTVSTARDLPLGGLYARTLDQHKRGAEDFIGSQRFVELKTIAGRAKHLISTICAKIGGATSERARLREIPTRCVEAILGNGDDVAMAYLDGLAQSYHF